MTKPIDIILLCGGKGTRFWPVTHDKIHKSLYRLNDVELMRFSLDTIDFSLVNSLIFAVGHHAEGVTQWINEQNFPCKVLFSTQTEPGVYGAVSAALDMVETEDFILCNTDEVREHLNMSDLLDFHEKSTGHLATMMTGNADHLFYHRIINKNNDHTVLSSELRNPEYEFRPEIVREVNVGFTVFNKKAISYFDNSYGIDWSAMVDPLIEKGLMKAFMNPKIAYFNVGTVNELEDAKLYFLQKNHLVSL